MSEPESDEKGKPLSEELLIHVDEESERPTIEWSENLYDRITEEVETFAGELYHDRELAIVGQAVDENIFVVCPEPRGTVVEPALRNIGFDPKRVETESARTVFRIESSMEVDDAV